MSNLIHIKEAGLYVGMLSDKCIYQRCIGVDAYNTPLYGTPTTLNCRKESKTTYVRKEQGEELVYRDVYILAVKDVEVKGLLDGRTITSRKHVTGIDGQYFYTEVYVE
jgi:hypothetical protein